MARYSQPEESVVDLVFWGGPVYCSTVQNIQWECDTFVFCHPLVGAANVDYAAQLTAAGNGSPLDALLAAAESTAQKAGVDFRAATVGSIALAGFSAAHQLINPILKVDGDRARINYVHLADSCFLGAGATSPHVGYAQFAAEASSSSSGKMMTITSHGPRGDIHYVGPDGHHYDLTSGTSCVQLFWSAGIGGASETIPDVPPGMPAPTASHRVGNAIWLEYDPNEHGDHANKFTQPMMQYYGAPFMADPGGGLMGTLKKLAGPLLVVGAAAAAWWYVSQRA
jgi:hypothetical protein